MEEKELETTTTEQTETQNEFIGFDDALEREKTEQKKANAPLPSVTAWHHSKVMLCPS